MDRIAHAVDTIPSTYSQVSRAVSLFCVGWDSLFVDLNMPRSHCFSSDECIQRSLDWSNRTMLRMYQDVFSTVVCFVFSFCINEPEDARFRYIVLRLPTSSPDFRCLWVQAIPVLYTLYTLCRNVVRLDVWIQCIQQTLGHLQLFLPCWCASSLFAYVFDCICPYLSKVTSVCWETCYWAALGTCPVSIHLTCTSHSPACLISQELGFGFGTFWSGNVRIGSVCGLKQRSPCGCFAPVSGSSSLWMCKHGSTWAISAPVVSVRSPDVVNKGICHAWFQGRMLHM